LKLIHFVLAFLGFAIQINIFDLAFILFLLDEFKCFHKL
jgi:hypothetical protein